MGDLEGKNAMKATAIKSLMMPTQNVVSFKLHVDYVFTLLSRLKNLWLCP